MSDSEDSPQTPLSRGIEPPERPHGPPPAPDFGLVARPQYRTAPTRVDDDPAASPQRRTRPWPVIAIVAAAIGVSVLIIALVVAGVTSLVSLTLDGDASPPFAVDDQGQSDPATDPATVEVSLQEMIDDYKSARDSGVLWNRIPDTEYNRTAVTAFLYFLTDLKLAASFGADTSDYLERADELEQKLLNGEPLGSDVTIQLGDRTFTYDGETGEGGYTDN